MSKLFERHAPEYDRWYDLSEGKAAFNAELDCMNAVCASFQDRWLEVGTGTGRFASALGIGYGIDPSPGMLELARTRKLRCIAGCAENLPCPDGVFDGVLMALTLCFLDKARQALEECRRVLSPEGVLLCGIVPADSPWGEAYIKKAAAGHPLYSEARFRTAAESVALIECAGFRLIDAASTLFWKPGEKSQRHPHVNAGIDQGAGFANLLFKKNGKN